MIICGGDLTDAYSIDFIGTGVNIMIQEIVLDGSYMRLALLVTAPLLFCVSIVRTLSVQRELQLMAIGTVLRSPDHWQFIHDVRP